MAADILLSTESIIGNKYPTFIIAEIGQNHQGDINIAKQLIKKAKECKADCVKFQKTNLQEKFNNAALLRKYESENSWGATYGEHKQFLEFTEEQFEELQTYAENIEIMFSASPMDLKSLDLLVKMGVPFIKIGSGDANNFLLIEKAAQTHIPLIISTGMQSIDTVIKIYETVSKYHKNFVLMQCVSAYPTPVDKINLKVIQLYQNMFPDIHIGYSGHEIGNELTPLAVAMGAKVIERHLTLDHYQKGADHICSLEPTEFAELVRKVREVERALGNGTKQLEDCEKACYCKLGKTIVAARFLTKGLKISKDDVKIKVAEPKGIDGTLLDDIIGKVLLTDVDEDQSILNNVLKE